MPDSHGNMFMHAHTLRHLIRKLNVTSFGGYRWFGQTRKLSGELEHKDDTQLFSKSVGEGE